jgi:hypothetical protein
MSHLCRLQEKLYGVKRGKVVRTMVSNKHATHPLDKVIVTSAPIG